MLWLYATKELILLPLGAIQRQINVDRWLKICYTIYKMAVRSLAMNECPAGAN
jgi:hypothetical protein